MLAGVWVLGGMAAFAADAPAPLAWQVRLPVIQSLLRHVFPSEAANAHYPVSVIQIADVSGTGGSDALINLGSGGYTDDVTVMQLQGDSPVAAKFRHGDSISPMVFINGTGDDHGGEVKFLTTDHAIFAGHWEMKGQKLKECHGDVYQWDSVGKNFNYAKKLSKEKSKEYCTAVVAKLHK